jgi:uncharacterized membrane protein
MEILQFKKLRESHAWSIVKSVFVILGTLTSFLALQTGESAEHAIGRSKVIEMHSNFATVATWLFGIMAVIYFVRIINNEFADIKDWCWNTKYIRDIWSILSKITDAIFKYWWILMIVGIIGLALISIVGGLGGAIVYGPNVYPYRCLYL